MNKVKKIIEFLLVACILVAIPMNAYAQGTGNTKAEVEFTAGNGPTYPIDPEDPDEELEDQTPVTGSLVIVSISDFMFGSITVSSASGLYPTTTTKPNIQIVDLRGTETGWAVNASVSRFTSGGSPSLPGAIIHIYNGRPNSTVAATYAPTQVTNLALTTDSSNARVITANAGTGMGLWAMRWYPPADQTGAYVQLEVPAGVATVGTHTATITWTLSDTP